MPIYHYKCSVCGKVVHRFRKIADREDPVCCKQQMSRLFLSADFILRGKNWAKDGYGKGLK